jgi:hypothetical protein|tara:strand:- start:778 stop:1182 length:405 start_codon:yes stop_codon:yes gene_type:complete
MTMLSDIGTKLAAASISTQDLTLGTNLFLGRLPESPDTCVAIYQTGGLAPIDQLGTAAPNLEVPGLQVRCRAASYSTGEALANDVWGVLVLILNETLTSTRYLRIEAQQSPLPLERDTQDRIIFVANYYVTKET